MDKITKIKELNDLFKSEAISETEFNTLKSEVIQGEDFNNSGTKQVSNLQKITLKSFQDSNGEIVLPPKIEFVDLKNVIDSELEELKPFLRLKQIHAPEEMTKDEIDLFNSIFTEAQTYEMNSERSGFNYVANSIFCVLVSIGILILVLFHPLMIFITGFLMVVIGISGIITLNKMDATKMDKRAVYISFVLIAISIAIFKFS
jgi:hypothetical protein